MTIAARIPIPREQLAEFCRRNQIRRLALFGSVLRPDFSPDSDVDVLVEFVAGASVGFIRLSALQLELSGLLGRTVDLRTPPELSRYFRDEVMATAAVQYAQG